MARLRLSSAAAILADLVLPRDCGGCGTAGPAVCPTCADALRGPIVMPAPGRVAAAEYAGVVRGMLLAFKERRRLDLTRPLGAALARAAWALAAEPAGSAGSAEAGVVPASQVKPPLVLVPVPGRRAAVRRRGFDQVARLCGAAARDLRGRGVDVRVARVLRARRRGADQAGLGAAERAVNRAGAFTVVAGASPAAGGIVIVVDDIVTTGATLTEATRALRSGDWAPVGAAAVAATPRRAP